MPFFDKDFILRVIDATDLVALVRGYLPNLRKESGRWVHCCPFHEEKSPSFGVKDRPAVKFFKCFGCGAGGDAIKFVRQMDGVSFPEAVKRLCARAGLPLPEGGSAGEWKQKRVKRSAEQIAADIAQHKASALALRASKALDRIVSQFPWSSEAMLAASQPLPDSPLEQARCVLRLFKPDDIVWCGSWKHSISEDDVATKQEDWIARVRACFRPASEWIASRDLVGPRICPCAMKPGALARSDASVLRRRFLVVEHDKLSLPGQAAVLRWLREDGGLKLRAVIFTGSKSLHGWFECPSADELAEAQTILCAMGYDRASFVPSQPYRLPGWENDKTNKPVRLMFVE